MCHKYAQLICKIIATIEMYSKVVFIPSLASIAQYQKLDSSDVVQILQALSNIPESNGAFVYLSPFDEVKFSKSGALCHKDIFTPIAFRAECAS